MSALSARQLTRIYPGGGGVRGLSLELPAGAMVALLGANGAGKSTLFRLLAGEERADSGSIYLGSVEVSRWPLHRRVRGGLGYLPQDPSVLPRLTVEQNLRVGLSGSAAERASSALERAGLSRLADQRAGTLSGGERRRVELARTLLRGPSVLLLDEPFSGIEREAVSVLRDELGLARDRGVAILYSAHVDREELDHCDGVWLLEDGQLHCGAAPS